MERSAATLWTGKRKHPDITYNTRSGGSNLLTDNLVTGARTITGKVPPPFGV